MSTGKVLREFAEPDWIPKNIVSPNRLLNAVFAEKRLRQLRGDDADGRRPSIHLEEASTGKLRRVLQGHLGDVADVAFSPDGKTLASGGQDGVVRVWEIATGKERLRLVGHQGRVFSVAFSPDGNTLASGSTDGTVLLWDVNGVTQPPAELTAAEVKAAWNDLAGEDALRAYRAVWRLRAGGKQALMLLKEELRPVAAVDAERLKRLIADLDNPSFVARQQATGDLEQLGELAGPALRRALANQPALEVSQRVERLLELLRGPVTLPDRLRALRAVEALERMGTPEARGMLKALAQGTPESWVTQEAKEALLRLK